MMDVIGITIVVCAAVMLFLLFMLAAEGRLIPLLDRRNPSPLVALCVEMLNGNMGWDSYGYQHSTGLRIHTGYAGRVECLYVDGERVSLRAGERRVIGTAIKRFNARRKVSADAEAAQRLSQSVLAMAERIQQMERKVVPFERRA